MVAWPVSHPISQMAPTLSGCGTEGKSSHLGFGETVPLCSPQSHLGISKPPISTLWLCVPQTWTAQTDVLEATNTGASDSQIMASLEHLSCHLPALLHWDLNLWGRWPGEGFARWQGERWQKKSPRGKSRVRRAQAPRTPV